MSQIIEVKVPDIGDFDEVPVIELFVKVGDSTPDNSKGSATITTSSSFSRSMSARFAVMFSSMTSGMWGATSFKE